eukprot:379173_1
MSTKSKTLEEPLSSFIQISCKEFNNDVVPNLVYPVMVIKPNAINIAKSITTLQYEKGPISSLIFEDYEIVTIPPKQLLTDKSTQIKINFDDQYKHCIHSLIFLTSFKKNQSTSQSFYINKFMQNQNCPYSVSVYKISDPKTSAIKISKTAYPFKTTSIANSRVKQILKNNINKKKKKKNFFAKKKKKH